MLSVEPSDMWPASGAPAGVGDKGSHVFGRGGEGGRTVELDGTGDVSGGSSGSAVSVYGAMRVLGVSCRPAKGAWS